MTEETIIPTIKKYSREHIHLPKNFGDKAADLVVSQMGSWAFLIVQSLVILFWIVANVRLLSRPFDPMPFILLNLLFSTQAAYASPLVLMASNRISNRDRARDDLEAAEVEQIHKMQEDIVKINTEQLDLDREMVEILRVVQEILKRTPDSKTD